MGQLRGERAVGEQEAPGVLGAPGEGGHLDEVPVALADVLERGEVVGEGRPGGEQGALLVGGVGGVLLAQVQRAGLGDLLLQGAQALGVVLEGLQILEGLVHEGAVLEGVDAGGVGGGGGGPRRPGERGRERQPAKASQVRSRGVESIENPEKGLGSGTLPWPWPEGCPGALGVEGGAQWPA